MRIIRYVGSSKSSDPDYLAELAGSEVAVIDTLPGGYNVTVTFKREAAPVWVPLRAEYRDLLDVAVTTYIADEVIARKDSIDSWSRNFDLLVPVKEPDRWRSAEKKLRHVLAVLSGDRYRFTWCPRVSLPDRVRHRQPLPRSYDVACLFSGGLDSLLGAYRLLAQGRKVLLVGHQAEGITASAQTDLARTLRGLFPNRCSLVQCRVARAPIRKPRYQLPDKVEESHRPRSLLFLALALVVARAADINELIAENGLIALNVPIQRSRLGTLSTRTAHPRYLEGLLDFLEAAGLFGGRIWNPFLFESKTDMLRSLPANLRDAALRSVSCSHAGRVPRRGGRAGVNHCGYCVPCLYRRAALIGAGIDDPSHYAHDVFQNLPSLTPTQQVDLRALVRFAERIRAASEFEREAMVLAHGFFPANLAGRIGPIAVTDYSLWTAMLRRWADDFLDVVRRLGTPSTLGVLGLSNTAEEGTSMKCLSVKQPWANLIASGQKTIETRTWATDYRGPLLIVSSKTPAIEPAGAAIAFVELVDCRPMRKSDEPAACCDMYPNAVAWVLSEIRRVRPVPIRGSLGLYEADVTPELLGRGMTA